MTDAVVRCGLLIRRPAAAVFEAFVDPAITARFWFSEGDGRLAPDARVTWAWAMSGFSGDAGARAAAALDGMNGFTLVLAGAKIWLEHGIEPRFVLDRHPDARVAGWPEA